VEKEIQEIFDKLALFDKMYEVIRFVDPMVKKVILHRSNAVSEVNSRCFDFWGKDQICDNCISIRAFNENKTFVKIEYGPDKVFMVTAIPYELENRRIVIELLKDTTNSMVFGNGEYDNNSEIYAMIDNMNNLVLKDPLTGVYNRRYINEKLPIDLINAALMESEISIVMADIDFFKRINDTYGHLAGDEILKSFASNISGCVRREGDWVARFGGEEFLICLPGADLETAVNLAEKMRTEVESSMTVTASFGVCTIKPGQDSKIEQFIECADKKLYAAKHNGRNRVEW